MADAYTYLTTDPRAGKYIIGWIYFHTKKSNEWRFIDYNSLNFDNRGQTEYVNNFIADAKFRDTANGYLVDLTP